MRFTSIALPRKRFLLLFALSQGVSFFIPSWIIANGFVLNNRRTSICSVTGNGSNSSGGCKQWRETKNARRAKLVNEEEEAELLIEALRGRSMNEDDRAADGVRLQLIENISFISGENDTSGVSLLKEEYDPEALKQFFSKRPLVVMARILQIMQVGGSYLLSLLLDQIYFQLLAFQGSGKKGKTYRDHPQLELKRAAQLRDIITSLGPFFIKLGQALSIRPDILSPRTMVELQKLCDKVPSFNSDIAFQTIESELGKNVSAIFSYISPEPLAAASLGQVYKATLLDTGESVAVKVQRPSVLETVSLDLYLARELGLLLKNIQAAASNTNMNSNKNNLRLDTVALLDEFAYRFYQELDYQLECQNGLKIRQQMSVLPMVVIPKNYPQYTTRRVHVAEWVEGEKLSQSKADDVGALVNLGVITYLTQLLEFGL